MFKSLYRTALLPLLLVPAACGSGESDPADPVDPTPSPFKEAVPEKTVYTQANLVYYGDDVYSGESDWWQLLLMTDMQIDETGNPVGPGKMIRISLNTTYNAEQKPDPELLCATYHEPASTADISAGTFNPGFFTTIDLPGGAVEMPDGSFFGDLQAGTTDFDADLLREGVCLIERREDGTYLISGILVGTQFRKRYFTYEGALDPIDRSDSQTSAPNTTLTEDLTLSGLTAARLIDKGDNFWLQDLSYRNFLLFLGGEHVDLSQSKPSGSGDVLRIELFVPWDSDPADGIPAGTYRVAPQSETGGIERQYIVPFNIVPGYPDQFTNCSGTWYQQFADSQWQQYARITGGTVTVERSGSAHRLTIDLTDCGTPAHHVRCTWEQTAPIAY